MRTRNQRGVVTPSPVVMLSVIAVAMAGIAFVATRGGEPAEREVATVAREAGPSTSPSAVPAPTKETKEPKPKPTVQRGKVYVEVYNNSGITGLAGRVAEHASGIGWQVVGSDNWYGTIPASTVYYPPKLKQAAKTLALDLGIRRTAPAVDPMRLDRLTLILTGPLG
ncbi:LytR C-terminal domain-containing protein [Nocardioides sp.]|uniref:LytR C-terminal domain-containing protein n=1 Tax=Nocardioides sp. TaxID=35761 RepID=UPI002624ED2D|nr:LytR C-terminal domain-containing protein [Nocardioides sp.]MDI6910999.1 LytR C-terminal domain-containing protein [Nocardioides sp.]